MAEIDYSQVTGLVHSTESFGSVYGPGIRFIVFKQRLYYNTSEIKGNLY